MTTIRKEVREAAREGVSWMLWGGMALVLILVATLVLWQVGWLFRAAGVGREDRLRRDRYEYQETYRVNVRDELLVIAGIDADLAKPDADMASLNAQRLRHVASMCDSASRLNEPLTGPNGAAVAKECGTR